MSALPPIVDIRRVQVGCPKSARSGHGAGAQKVPTSKPTCSSTFRHVFLGEAHARNERKTWTVIAICTAMMVAEIVGGVWFGTVALVADGLHMSTHAGALVIAA